jgi:hypothetical protein
VNVGLYIWANMASGGASRDWSSFFIDILAHVNEYAWEAARIAWLWTAIAMRVLLRWAHDVVLPRLEIAWQAAKPSDLFIASTVGYLSAVAIAPFLVRCVLRIFGFGPRGPVAGSLLHFFIGDH